MKPLCFLVIVAAIFTGSCRSWFNKSANASETANANAGESPFASITDANDALAEGARLLDENDTQMAIAAFQRAIELNPDLPDAHFQLGIAYGLLDLQNQQEGNILPGDTEARIKTRSEKEFEKAAAAYKKYLADNPRDDAAQFNLGRTYVKLLKDDLAEDAFREAVKLKPDDADYQTELGAILIRLAKYHEAIPPLKKAIELDPTNARAQDLLEDAQAGRSRLDYVSNSNVNANRNANANANVNANGAVGNSNVSTNGNTTIKPPANSKPQPSPIPRETPRKGGPTVDSRLRHPN
ncbi:MAG TPA: tetratricopeptide repeat protein [Pyrinomonadaceae bacterium]|jgi:tetratricopeptide (TPR) repeat protein|nr:tetratricopeptide repeat protein [Pyrinomonadaceae bacterium]